MTIVHAFLPAYPPYFQAGSALMSAEILSGLAARGASVTAWIDYGTPEATRPHGELLDGVRILSRQDYAPGEHPAPDYVYTHADHGTVGRLHADRWRKPCTLLAACHNVNELSAYGLGALRPDLMLWNADATRRALDPYGSLPGIRVTPLLRVAEHRVTRPPSAAFITALSLTDDKGGPLVHTLSRMMPDVPFLGIRGPYGEQNVPLEALTTVEGPYPRAELPRAVWSRTALFLAPSRVESWGMAACEALCSGIPVLAHPAPGLREALDDAALYCDRESPERWQHEIRALTTDPAWYALHSHLASERATALEATARHERQIFHDLLGWPAPTPHLREAD